MNTVQRLKINDVSMINKAFKKMLFLFYKYTEINLKCIMPQAVS